MLITQEHRPEAFTFKPNRQIRFSLIDKSPSIGGNRQKDFVKTDRIHVVRTAHHRQRHKGKSYIKLSGIYVDDKGNRQRPSKPAHTTSS